MIVLLNTHKPDRLFPTSNSDRPSSPANLIAYFHIKQRSPITTTNPIAYPLKSNSDRPFHHPHNLIAYFPNRDNLTLNAKDKEY
ncbi:hypothetical protein [Pseudanabaena mucicola]|uniref:hypothetical protein n=1 Tax=Pseudanabaena mucicola TaxID=71190 RepID=UPI002578EFC0|nr:hypothetical protein [Pseudanabaena mucicola]